MSDRLDRIETNLEVLSERTGQLAQDVSDLRGSVLVLSESVSNLREELRTSTELANEARREDIQVMVGIVDTLSDSIRGLRETQMTMIQQSNADRAAWQAGIQRVWDYLVRQNPNGHGE